jgi:hypothetical protein
VGKTLDANPTIEAYTDRREALKDADFVINMVQIGGFDSTLVDFEIPRKYGLNFTIADTTGPGGFFRALRTYPMLTGPVRGHDGRLSQSRAAQLLQPDVDEHADDLSHIEHSGGWPVPQRSGHAR